MCVFVWKKGRNMATKSLGHESRRRIDHYCKMFYAFSMCFLCVCVCFLLRCTFCFCVFLAMKKRSTVITTCHQAAHSPGSIRWMLFFRVLSVQSFVPLPVFRGRWPVCDSCGYVKGY